MSISRLGSVLNANIIPSIFASSGLGTALLVGFIICCGSLGCAIILVLLDIYADKKNKNGEKAKLADDEKFQFSDIKNFKLPFWLLCLSCMVTYMSVFPYIQYASDVLQKKYNFSPEEAGSMSGYPYIISACSSPFLGFMIDKIGKRAVLITCSSIVLIIAYLTSMLMPSCD